MMRLKRLVACAALLSIGAVPAGAVPGDDWRILGFSESPNGASLVLIDAAATSPTPGTRQVTTNTVFEQERKLSTGDVYAMLEIVYVFDCEARTIAVARSAAWSAEQTVVGTSNQPQDARPLGTGSLLEKGFDAACGADFDGLARVEAATPVAEATDRFAQRSDVGASLDRTGWRRMALSGTTPQRNAFYADPASPTTDALGRRLVTIMSVPETPTSSTSRFHYRARIDCAAHTGQYVYGEGFDAQGENLSSVIVPGEPRPISPGSPIATLVAPLCDGDWSGGVAVAGLPAQIAREVFAQ